MLSKKKNFDQNGHLESSPKVKFNLDGSSFSAPICILGAFCDHFFNAEAASYNSGSCN